MPCFPATVKQKIVHLILMKSDFLTSFCLILSLKIFFFVYLFLVAWALDAARSLSLVAVSGGYCLVAVHRLLIAAASLVAEHRLQAHGLQ